MGVGGGKNKSPQGRKEMPKEIITSVSIQQEIKLHKAEKAWKPQQKQKKDNKDVPESQTEKLFRQVTSILNKLTPQKFNTLVQQMTGLSIDTEERLKGVVDLIFEKAVREPGFCVAYANMCKYMMKLSVRKEDKPGEFEDFRKLLLNQCQREFEKDNPRQIEYNARMEEIQKAEESLRPQMLEELEISSTKARRRSLGNIRFIGELFKLKMLTENIMHHCVLKLLKSHDEESLECLCRLLCTIGKELDTEGARPRVDQYFKEMAKIVAQKKTSSRVQFMIQDVIELRQNRWVPRREENAPKTIDQFRKEAAQGAQEKAALNMHHMNTMPQQRGGLGGRADRDSHRGGRPQGQPNTGEDGWSTVGVRAARATIDPTKLKLSKPTDRMEEDAACSLCMEVFTDPISLPCGHGFCRGCLKSLVGHISGKRRGEKTSSKSTNLPCPMCRTEVTLGPSGVDKLHLNQDLSNLMRTRAEMKESAATTPLCDMCESDNRKADHYCANCVTLYCEPCLAVVHPPRGPLRRHRLMSIEQYLSEQTSHQADLKTTLGEADGNIANCKEHKQPLTLYCGSCERPICIGCISGHNDHLMQDVSTACTRNKDPLETQVDCCRSIKSELEKLQTELVATQKDIQTKTEEEHKQIEADYKRGLKSLQDWRKSERDKVDDKRDTLTTESLSLLKSINLLMEETERLLTSSADLLSKNEALFLLESKDLVKRLQCHSTETNKGFGEKRQKIAELRSALSRCDFLQCVVKTVPQGTCKVTAPLLKFTESDKADVTIGEDGLVVQDKPREPVRFTTVRTDGLITGTEYWEVAVSWRLSSPPPRTGDWCLVCTAGVRQEGSDFRSAPGYDHLSYAVWIRYQHSTKNYRFECWHKRKGEFKSAQHTSRDKPASHHVGFLYQPSERSLNVVDMETDTRLHTFRGLDMSRPFVPVVMFGWEYFHRTIRVLSVDQSSPLGHVFDIINR